MDINGKSSNKISTTSRGSPWMGLGLFSIPVEYDFGRNACLIRRAIYSAVSFNTSVRTSSEPEALSGLSSLSCLATLIIPITRSVMW